jgi:pimeloyl-ACP methyl ester carboxylesterase
MSVALKALIVAMVLMLVLALLTAITSLILPWQTALVIWGGLLTAAFLWAGLMPVSTGDLVSRANPAATPEEARERFAILASRDGPEVIDICHSRLMAGEGRARRTVAIFHGLSSCPHAQVEIIPRIHDEGCAVLVARMPYHGMRDNKSDSLRHYLGPAIVAHVDEVIDIAAGLGDELVVAGISGGAVLAGWAAQTRPEVKEAVLIAPFYGMATFGDRFNMLLMRLLLLVPNMSIWKNPLKGSRSEAPPHNMVRQSSRGVADMMRVGLATRRLAVKERARGDKVLLVLNDADIAISNEVAESMGHAFEAGGTPVERVRIPRHYQLPHELIDPVQIGDKVAIVNPALTGLLAWSRLPQVAAEPGLSVPEAGRAPAR